MSVLIRYKLKLLKAVPVHIVFIIIATRESVSYTGSTEWRKHIDLVSVAMPMYSWHCLLLARVWFWNCPLGCEISRGVMYRCVLTPHRAAQQQCFYTLQLGAPVSLLEVTPRSTRNSKAAVSPPPLPERSLAQAWFIKAASSAPLAGNYTEEILHPDQKLLIIYITSENLWVL